MRKCLHTPLTFRSQYGLLGTFAEQIGRAAARCGWAVDEPLLDDDSSTILLINNTTDLDSMLAKAGEARIVQLFVDHPLTMRFDHLKILQGRSHYEAVFVTPDDLHLANLRFPALTCRHVMHGVDRDLVMSADDIAASYTNGQRDIDVLYCGSIVSEEELEERRLAVPAPLHKYLDSMASMRLNCPEMSMGQVWDACVAPGRCSDYWTLMCLAFMYVSAYVGRYTRLETVKSLQGHYTTVIGSAEWEKHCTGTVKYGGEIPYADLHKVMRRAKACVCDNPPQFVMGTSERVLLAMASGCAVVSDYRHELDQIVGLDAISMDGTVPIDRLLSGTEGMEMGMLAAKIVAEEHTWDHRIPALLG